MLQMETLSYAIWVIICDSWDQPQQYILSLLDIQSIIHNKYSNTNNYIIIEYMCAIRICNE